MSDPAENPILDKIRKLLRVGEERGATQAECENALALAQRLATTNNINLAEVDAQEVTGAGEPIVDESYTPERSGGGPVERKMPVANKFIVWILKRYFAVRILEGTKWNEKELRHQPSLNIIGRKTNVQIAIYVYGFLYHEFQRRWRDHKRATDAPMYTRNSYYNGLYQGLSAKLEETKGAAELEAQEQLAAQAKSSATADQMTPEARAASSMALVLRGEAEKVEPS